MFIALQDLLNPCATCGLYTDELRLHHVLPRSMGGTDLASNVVRVCAGCNSSLHAASINKGLAKAKAAGTKFGAPSKCIPEVAAIVHRMRAAGGSYKAIAAAVGLSMGSVHGICKPR